MANITVNADEVTLKVGNAKQGVAGAAIAAGEFIYFDSADNGRAKLADANGTGEARFARAVALNSATAAGQPIDYADNPGDEIEMDTSAFATAGQPIILSGTPGKCTETLADFVTGWYWNLLGTVKAGGKILRLFTTNGDTAK